MKRSFFQAAVVLIMLYGCTTWTLKKRLQKKLDGNYSGMLRVILNNSRWQHPTKHQLYGHLPPIKKTIQVRRTRLTGHELIRDVLLLNPTYGRAKITVARGVADRVVGSLRFQVLFTNPSARAGYDTRSIFKRSLTGFEFRVFLLLD